jgi:hypothetical protein
MAQQEQDLTEMSDEMAVDAEEAIERPVPEKKRSKGIGLLLICLILFAGAFFAARQFGGSIPGLSNNSIGNNSVVAPSAAAEPAPPIVAPVNTSSAAPAPATVVAADPLALETPAAPISQDVLNTPPMSQAPVVETSIPQDVLPAAEVMPPETVSAPVMPVVPVIAETAVIPEAPQISETADITPDMPKAEIHTVENNTLPEAVLNNVSEPKSDQSSEVKEVLARIEDRLTALEAQVQNQSENSAPSSSIADLQKDVELIKASLQDLQKAARERQDAKARSAAAADVRRGYGLPRQTSKTASSVRAESSATLRSQPAQQAPLSWRLRSAKPGKAWVTPVGSNEITLVQPGDNLPGLGKITVVGKDSQSGRWFVQGALGRIEQ